MNADIVKEDFKNEFIRILDKHCMDDKIKDIVLIPTEPHNQIKALKLKISTNQIWLWNIQSNAF